MAAGSSTLGLQNSYHEWEFQPIENEAVSYPQSAKRAAQPNLLVFNSKNAFLEYFESQYPVEELLDQYETSIRKTGVNAPPNKILVQVAVLNGGKKFGQKYQLEFKFNIKPVPQ